MTPGPLDGWILEEQIGAGGLADVWRARASGDPHAAPVAIKLLREPSRSPAHRARFLREGRLLQRLAHPGLPTCLQVVEGDHPYLVLELLQGQTLAARLRRVGALEARAVIPIASGIMEVLAHLHLHGVIHRDVKADNIYLCDDTRVLLVDLGLAAEAAAPLTTTLGEVLGTYAYMAPEQIAGAVVDHRADLYSLGVTLYEALAGTRPYHARDAQGVLRAHNSGRVSPLAELCPGAPERLVTVIGRLMARDPWGRPGSATIAHALLIGGVPSRADLTPPPLVGRAAAVGAIEAAIDAPGAAVLIGDVGSGLGRLAAWAVSRARALGCETLAVRCRARAASLRPILELAQDLEGWAGRVPTHDAEGVGEVLRDLSEEGPVMVVVEDVERCSAQTAQALARIQAMAPRLTLLMTGRRPLPEVSAHQVVLRALTVDEVEQLIAGMLTSATAPAGLAARLHHDSGGQPAIVVLAIRDLVARGALRPDTMAEDGTRCWTLDPRASTGPTVGLKRLFGAVLARLSEGARALLEVLAAVGEATPVETAISLAASDPSGVEVFELVRAGLVTTEGHTGGDRVMLRRPAIAELVLTQVPAAREMELHRRLADALRRLPPDPWRDQRAAWHAAHGAPPGAAPRALLELARDLHAKGQTPQALAALERASGIPGTAARTSAEVAIARGQLLGVLSRRSDAITALIAGRRLALELDEDNLIGSAMIELAAAYRSSGDERRAASLREDGLERLLPLGPTASLATGLLLSAQMHRAGARPTQASELYHRCLTAAAAIQHAELQACATGGLAALAAEEGRLNDAAEGLETEVSTLRMLGRAHALTPALVRLGVCRRRQGRVSAALDALDEADDVARLAGLAHARSEVRVGRAAVMLAVGDLAAARRLLSRATLCLDPQAHIRARLDYRDVQAQLRLMLGDLQAALAVYQIAEAEAKRAGFTVYGSFFLGMIGVLTADPQAITRATGVLSVAGDRRLAARLLSWGSTIGDDPDLLAAAEAEARVSGDQFLLLDLLHRGGGSAREGEALGLCRVLLSHIPTGLAERFLSLPAVSWSRLPARLRHDPAHPRPRSW